MTEITHDLRPPLVVVVGKFNPAIFTDFWIATELYEIRDGQEMQVTETTLELPNGLLLTLTFLEGVGINFADDKIQISLVDFEEATIAKARTVLKNIFEKLPHTPVGAVGVNLRWFDGDPPQEVMDLFDTPEGFEAAFELVERTHRIKIMEDGFVLNFSRHLTAGEAVFDFNYHRSVSSADEIVDMLSDEFIQMEFAHSKQILEKFFSYDEFGALSFKDGVEKSEGEGNAEVHEAEIAKKA